MFRPSTPALLDLCQRLRIDPDFFAQCVQEAVVEVRETEGRLELENGTVLRLRRLERICTTMNMDLPGALLLLELTQRIAELEAEVRLLRKEIV